MLSYEGLRTIEPQRFPSCNDYIAQDSASHSIHSGVDKYESVLTIIAHEQYNPRHVYLEICGVSSHILS